LVKYRNLKEPKLKLVKLKRNTLKLSVKQDSKNSILYILDKCEHNKIL